MSTQASANNDPCANFSFSVQKKAGDGIPVRVPSGHCIDSPNCTYFEVEDGDEISFIGSVFYTGKLPPNQAVIGLIFLNDYRISKIVLSPSRPTMQKGNFRGTITRDPRHWVQIVSCDPSRAVATTDGKPPIPVLKVSWELFELRDNENYMKPLPKSDKSDFVVPVSASTGKKGDLLSVLVPGTKSDSVDTCDKKWMSIRTLKTDTYFLASDFSLVANGKKRYAEASSAAGSSTSQAREGEDALGPKRAERRKRKLMQERGSIDLTL